MYASKVIQLCKEITLKYHNITNYKSLIKELCLVVYPLIAVTDVLFHCVVMNWQVNFCLLIKNDIMIISLNSKGDQCCQIGNVNLCENAI